eukprot:1840513-Pleurochrysis_carterae.AAC.1
MCIRDSPPPPEGPPPSESPAQLILPGRIPWIVSYATNPSAKVGEQSSALHGERARASYWARVWSACGARVACVL